MVKEIVLSERVELVSDLATRVSTSEAEKMLMVVAEEGDDKALEVLKELPHNVKAMMVREGDFSKPSFAGMLSEPQDVVDIMVSNPGIWLSPSSIDEDDIMELLAEISTICTSLILSKIHAAWYEELFESILASEEATLYLMTCFMGCVDQDMEFDEFHFTFSKSQTGDGEVSHLYEMIHEHGPELERKIAELICSYNAAGHESNWLYGDVVSVLLELYEKANKSSVAETAAAPDALIEDL